MASLATLATLTFLGCDHDHSPPDEESVTIVSETLVSQGSDLCAVQVTVRNDDNDVPVDVTIVYNALNASSVVLATTTAFVGNIFPDDDETATSPVFAPSLPCSSIASLQRVDVDVFRF
jgi:hypothetical protein